MKTCADYVRDAKAKLGDAHMSDRQLGELMGVSGPVISTARYGRMSDPLALKFASVVGAEAGEVVMVARMEREADPAVANALRAWVGKVFTLMPTKAPALEAAGRGMREAAQAAHGAAWRKRFLPLPC